MITQDELEQRFPECQVTRTFDPPFLIQRLDAALKSKGKTDLSNFEHQFFAAKGNFMGYTEQCAFRRKTGGELFISDPSLWERSNFYTICVELSLLA